MTTQPTFSGKCRCGHGYQWHRRMSGHKRLPCQFIQAQAIHYGRPGGWAGDRCKCRDWHPITSISTEATTMSSPKVTTLCRARHPMYSNQVRCDLERGHDGEHFSLFYARRWSDGEHDGQPKGEQPDGSWDFDCATCGLPTMEGLMSKQCDRCGSVIPPERHQSDCPNAPEQMEPQDSHLSAFDLAQGRGDRIAGEGPGAALAPGATIPTLRKQPVPPEILTALVACQVAQDATQGTFRRYLDKVGSPEAARLYQEHVQADQHARQALRDLMNVVPEFMGMYILTYDRHGHTSLRRRTGARAADAWASYFARGAAEADGWTRVTTQIFPEWMAGREDLVQRHQPDGTQAWGQVHFTGYGKRPWVAIAFGVPPTVACLATIEGLVTLRCQRPKGHDGDHEDFDQEGGQWTWPQTAPASPQDGPGAPQGQEVVS